MDTKIHAVRRYSHLSTIYSARTIYNFTVKSDLEKILIVDGEGK